VLVISPHLDDAVLGCGQLLADSPGSTVVTVFAGSLPVTAALTEWDAAAGFRPGDDPMAIRREEDRAALAHFRAKAVWLEFLDAQYGRPPPVESVAQQVHRAIVEASPDRVFIPLGLFHSDHRLTSQACVAVALRHPEIEWLAYEEPTYRHIDGLVDERLRALRIAAVKAEPRELALGDACLAEKRAAVAEYRSQVRALSTPGRPGYTRAFEPERYWQLRVPSYAESGGSAGRAELAR